MLIREARDPSLDRAREMKVKIPVSYHVRLHSVKILTGKPISAVVLEALDAYFALADAPSPPAAAPAADAGDAPAAP